MPHSFSCVVVPSGHIWSCCGVRRGHTEYVLCSLVPFTTVAQRRCCDAYPFQACLQTTVSSSQVKVGCLLCMAKPANRILGGLAVAIFLSKVWHQRLLMRVVISLYDRIGTCCLLPSSASLVCSIWQLMRSLVTSIFLYACESRTLTAELKRKIQVMEMQCYCKTLHISYKDHVTNKDVCAKIQQAIRPHKDLLTVVKRCKLQW